MGAAGEADPTNTLEVVKELDDMAAAVKTMESSIELVKQAFAAVSNC